MMRDPSLRELLESTPRQQAAGFSETTPQGEPIVRAIAPYGISASWLALKRCPDRSSGSRQSHGNTICWTSAGRCDIKCLLWSCKIVERASLEANTTLAPNLDCKGPNGARPTRHHKRGALSASCAWVTNRADTALTKTLTRRKPHFPLTEALLSDRYTHSPRTKEQLCPWLKPNAKASKNGPTGARSPREQVGYP